MTPYTLSPSLVTKHEMQLRIPLLDDDGYESRGAILAKALRGRYACEMKCFYLTPKRAQKWETLYRAGFAARQQRCGCDYVWRFIAPPVPVRPAPMLLKAAVETALAALKTQVMEIV